MTVKVPLVRNSITSQLLSSSIVGISKLALSHYPNIPSLSIPQTSIPTKSEKNMMHETPMDFDADPICQVVFSAKSQYTLTMLKSQKKKKTSNMPDESSVFPFFLGPLNIPVIAYFGVLNHID